MAQDYAFNGFRKFYLAARDIVYFLSVIVVALVATRATVEERT